jgi:ABC-2 type transport system ATP-binding protein
LEAATSRAATVGGVNGLDVNDLHVSFGSVRALTGMHVRVEPGQLLGFLGPNGAGKTTTMRAILGLVGIEAGTVEWNGTPVDDAARRTIGYMPEERGLYPRMKVHEQVTYFGRLAGLSARGSRDAAASWLDRLGLGDRLASQVQDLSHGNQQRVQLAVALVHEPTLLVLDEPFSGLDPLAVATMSRIITERAAAGVAVLFSSHQLDLVEGLCDDVVIVDHGHPVATGTVGALRSASPRRIVRIELEHESAVGAAWPPRIPDAEVIEAGPLLYRASVPRELAPGDVLHALGPDHLLRSFSVEPPPLSTVFVEALS